MTRERLRGGPLQGRMSRGHRLPSLQGRPWRLLAAALAILSTLHYLRAPSGWLRHGVVHVAPDGFDGFIGRSRRDAVRTLQRAADIAEPGETILIWPGVYREDVHLRRGGTPGRSLVLRAAVPGQAVISGGADPKVMAPWRWQSRGGHLWSTTPGWRVDGLRWRGVMAFRSRSLAQLRAICARPGAWPAFVATPRELWLCLPHGDRPTVEGLEVHRPIPARTRSGGHQVASLWIEAPHVEVRDLRFDFSVMAAIQLWHTHHVRIEGNQFNGADVAVNDNPSVAPATAIQVIRNVSSCYPLYEWGRHGWLSWQELYPYSNCSLTWLRGKDLAVESNIILQAGDGIKLSPSGGSNHANNNLIAQTTDDAFEFDGLASHLTVAHNFIRDPFVALAPSPASAGPLLIAHNTIVIAPRDPKVGYGVLLKLMGGAIRRVVLRNNVYVGYSLGFGTADSPVTGMRIEANGLATLTGKEDGLAQAGQIQWRGNRHMRLSLAQWQGAIQRPSVVAAVGAKPVALGPIGPAWMVLAHEPLTAPLRTLLQSPWLVAP